MPQRQDRVTGSVSPPPASQPEPQDFGGLRGGQWSRDRRSQPGQKSEEPTVALHMDCSAICTSNQKLISPQNREPPLEKEIFQSGEFICHYPQCLLHGGTSITTHSTREESEKTQSQRERAMAEAGSTPDVLQRGERFKNMQATNLTESTLKKRVSNRKD